MTKRILAVLAIAAATGLACDPYGSDLNGGTPAIQQVVTPDPANAALGAPPNTATAPATPGGPWTLTGVDASANYLVFVILNKLMDGATVQQSTASCVPANNWLTVAESKPAAPCANVGETPTWYACYDPASPDGTKQGASIVIYRSCVPDSTGWGDAEPLTAGTTYTFSGSIKDKQGNALEIPVSLTTN
ncbi:hypothetical protein [Anaeromyxobacter oryzae]|uniref:Uncharacterized protein n=1 Tax=Anaeromyxobacter oryzae TaxID=2918170 RepID=A0ABN6MVN0_9BACT|nr:hypothetical protein [Anaeromyxobacter oryzae]BDG03854.1 hypothetical protein AMOR_28500 [Anaeromyxobacter oryzae]